MLAAGLVVSVSCSSDGDDVPEDLRSALRQQADAAGLALSPSELECYAMFLLASLGEERATELARVDDVDGAFQDTFSEGVLGFLDGGPVVADRLRGFDEDCLELLGIVPADLDVLLDADPDEW